MIYTIKGIKYATNSNGVVMFFDESSKEWKNMPRQNSDFCVKLQNLAEDARRQEMVRDMVSSRIARQGRKTAFPAPKTKKEESLYLRTLKFLAKELEDQKREVRDWHQVIENSKMAMDRLRSTNIEDTDSARAEYQNQVRVANDRLRREKAELNKAQAELKTRRTALRRFMAQVPKAVVKKAAKVYPMIGGLKPLKAKFRRTTEEKAALRAS